MGETYRLQGEAGPIAASEVRYIKLGANGALAAACIEAGLLRLGFADIPHDLCVRGDWDAVTQRFLKAGKTIGKAHDHVRELRAFYELPADALWITFAGGALWWCFGKVGVSWDDSATAALPRRRATVSGWSSRDTRGQPILLTNLSTSLTTVRGYRSTICEVRERDYLLRKINGEEEPLVTEASVALDSLHEIAVRLIKRLHEKEFELLVDLILNASGWRRVSILGESEADIDLLVEQVATNERAFVQVKSKASPTVLDDYLARFKSYPGVNRMIFACHSPTRSLEARGARASGVDLWLVDALAQKAVRAGLFDWLIARVR